MLEKNTSGRFKILVAEDNKINQKLILILLNKAGYDVDIANNGREAIEMTKKGKYDLIVMDIQMPEVDGIEAAKRIREWEKDTGMPRIPIIALTASLLTPDEEKEFLKGDIDSYLSKPIDKKKLYSLLESYLKH